MTKKVQKILSALMCLMLLVCLLPVSASAAGYTASLKFIDGWWQIQSNGEVTTQINGAGTYTLTLDLGDQTAHGTGELTVSIPGGYDELTAAGIAVTSVSAGGHEILVDSSKVLYDQAWAQDEAGNWYATGELQIKIYLNWDSNTEGSIDTAYEFTDSLAVTLTVGGSGSTEEPGEDPTEDTTEAPSDEPSAPLAPEATSGTELWTGSTTVEANWGYGSDVMTTVCGGSFDPAVIAEGGYFSICYTGVEGQIYMAMQHPANWDDWFQLTPTSTKASGDGYVSTFSYADLVKAYGTDDFSGLGKLIFGTTEPNGAVTFTRLAWHAPEVTEEPSEDPSEDPTEDTTEAPEESTEAPTEETTEAPGASDDGILLDGNTHEQPAAWTIVTELSTTLAEGTVDPALFKDDGYISVTYTGTEGALYMAVMDATAWGWYQVNAPASTTKNADGSYTSVFNRSDLAAVYGGKSDFSDLGKIIVGTAESTTTTVVTRIAWHKTEETKTWYSAKLGYAAAGDWEPNEWGDNASTSVSGGGTYTIVWNPSAAADGAEVFVIDIVGGSNLYKTCSLTGVSVVADGVSIPVDMSKVKFGDLEYNGNLRIELYNAYGATASAPAIDLSALNFSEELVVTFTLYEVPADSTNSGTGDSFDVAMVGTLLVSAMAICALVVTRKKWTV